MGCGSSKLGAPGMLHSWLSQRGTDTIDRRGFSKDQLLSPLEVTSPTAIDSPSKSMSDDDHRKVWGDEVEEKEDSKISASEGGGEDDDIVNEEGDDKGEDSIRHCSSPSFRVYCLDNGNDNDNDNEEDEDEKEDKDNDGVSINSCPSETARMVETQQELDDSSVGETLEMKESKRSRAKKLIQKDMFKGAGKNLRQLKLPHRRSASTDSHYQVELHDPTEQPQSTSLGRDQTGHGSSRRRRRHKLPLRLPHRSSAGSSRDIQSDDKTKGCNNRGRRLKLPHFSRRSSSDEEEGSNHSARDDTSSQDNQSECNDHHRRHLKLPHLSCHGSVLGDGDNRRVDQANSRYDDQANDNDHDDRRSRSTHSSS